MTVPQKTSVATETTNSCQNRNSETLREHIRAAELIEALESHAIHGTDMTSTQVSAALALLKKTLPDLPTAGPAESGLSHEEALDRLA